MELDEVRILWLDLLSIFIFILDARVPLDLLRAILGEVEGSDDDG